jgi:hypothetical protein
MASNFLVSISLIEYLAVAVRPFLKPGIFTFYLTFYWLAFNIRAVVPPELRKALFYFCVESLRVAAGGGCIEKSKNCDTILQY